MKKTESYEERLLAEIAAVDRGLNDLVKNRETLNRLLLKARQENVHLRDVTRKNSLKRILVERSVISTLNDGKAPVRAGRLFSIAQNSVYNLTNVSFRTTLHRMKKAGLIQSAGNGLWILPPKK